MHRINPDTYNGAAWDNVFVGGFEQITQLNPEAAYDGTALNNAPFTVEGIRGSPAVSVIEVPILETKTDNAFP